MNKIKTINWKFQLEFTMCSAKLYNYRTKMHKFTGDSTRVVAKKALKMSSPMANGTWWCLPQCL